MSEGKTGIPGIPALMEKRCHCLAAEVCTHKLTPQPKHVTCTRPFSEKQLKMHPEISSLPSAAGPLGRHSSFRHYHLVLSLERAVAFACLHQRFICSCPTGSACKTGSAVSLQGGWPPSYLPFSSHSFSVMTVFFSSHGHCYSEPHTDT